MPSSLPFFCKIPSENFDARATVECGQVFRFENNGGIYEIVSSDKKCLLETKGEYTYLYTEYGEYFHNYFDLDRDYGQIVDALSGFPELSEAVKIGKGIRILNQDLFETIISFIISANNNIPRIKKIIERLCRLCGRKIGDYYAFPDLCAAAKLSFEDWQTIGAGFRDKYLFETVRILKNTSFLEKLSRADTDEATELLLTLPGVGPKVADCILLFGLHRTDSYPVDTWIFKSCRTDELNTTKAVHKYYRERYGELAGYAQQYVFYAARENPQR